MFSSANRFQSLDFEDEDGGFVLGERRPTLTRQNSRGKERPKPRRSIKLDPINHEGQPESNHHNDARLSHNHNHTDRLNHAEHPEENHSRGISNEYHETNQPRQLLPQQQQHRVNGHQSSANEELGQCPTSRHYGLPPSHSMPNAQATQMGSPIPPLPQTSPPQYSSPFFNGTALTATASASPRTFRHSASTGQIQPLRLASQLPLDLPPPYEEHQSIPRRQSSNRQDAIDLSVSGGGGGGGGEDPSTSINIRLGGAQGGGGGGGGADSSSGIEDFTDAESRFSINVNHTG